MMKSGQVVRQVRNAYRPALEGWETCLRASFDAEPLPAEACPCCKSCAGLCVCMAVQHSSDLTCDDGLPLVAAGAHHSWFHLYRTLLLRDAALLDQSAATAVQQYLQTATLGEFAERLTMVKTFGWVALSACTKKRGHDYTWMAGKRHFSCLQEHDGSDTCLLEAEC